MATFHFFDAFIDELSKGTHNLQSDTLKVALTNTAPVAASQTTWNTTDHPAPASANGYTAGGNTLSTSGSTTSGTFKLTATDSVFTASGGDLGPWRYAVVYNSSQSNKAVGYYDKGGSITQASGEPATVDFDGATGFITLPKSA